MSIRIQAITQTESAVNEDIYGFSDTEAWLLDGATSISGRKMEIDSALQTDASWFVQRVSEGIRRRLGNSNLRSSLPAILRSVSSEARGVWGTWSDVDTPSASLCHVVVRAGQVTFSNLGDCRILYQRDGGTIETFGVCGVQILDAELLAEFSKFRLQHPTYTHTEIWGLVVPRIRGNRSRMNTSAGYWILSPDAAGADHTEELTVEYHHSLRVLLVSDGLYRLVDTYNEYTVSDFFDRAFDRDGLSQFVTRLRGIEAGDQSAEKFPRVKLKDDATGLAIDIQRVKKA
jgi:Protein phosphatase 2C